MNLRNTCSKVCDSRSMHVWWTVMWWSRSMIYLLIVFLMSGGRDRAMVNSYQPFPWEHARSTLFWWLIDFCNKYVSSLWVMLSPWIIRTLILPPLLASLVPRNFRQYHTPTIYLPKNSHHTYLLWHFHSHSEIYCHATSHRSVYRDTSIIVILPSMIM